MHTLSSAGTETGVQIERNLVEDGGGNQGALVTGSVANEPYLHVPGSLGETFHLRLFVAGKISS
jgi:hypothetical protein